MNQGPGVKAREDRLNIGVAMLLIAGAAIGICMACLEVRGYGWGDLVDSWFWWEPVDQISAVAGFFLGGLSLVGPPLLLDPRSIASMGCRTAALVLVRNRCMGTLASRRILPLYAYG